MSLGRGSRGRAALEQASRERGKKETNGKKPGVGSVIAGGFILLFGIRLLWSAAVTSILFSRMDVMDFLGGAVFCISGYKLMLGKEKVKKEKPKKEPGQRPSRQIREEEQWKQYIPKSVETKTSGFSFKANDHRHILPTGISVEKQLKQLDVLMGAGLYTKEEYRAAKVKILSRR